MNVLVVFGRVDTVTEGVSITLGLALEPFIKACQRRWCLSRSLKANLASLLEVGEIMALDRSTSKRLG